MMSDFEIIARLKAKAAAGRPAIIKPDTAFRLALALEAGNADPTWPDEFPFTVEAWNLNGSLWRTEARCRMLTTGQGAFGALKGHYKDYRLTLRQGIRVIEEA